MTYWRIEGFDGTTKFCDHALQGNLSDGEVQSILRHLAARHLEVDEIIFASLRKRMRGRRSDFDLIPINGNRCGWMTAGNPYYIAFRELG